ncbi:nucleotide sugar dehydrogenase [Pelagibacterales bacterium SAG-MED45]|nr:nucleotide sugar dehydrogenase [Pelagibacterales bacterium SAG-MED45]
MVIKNLLKDFYNKKIKIGVIGLGYVGLPLAILFSKKGFKVFGFDTDVEKIKLINSKKSPIERIPDSNICLLLKKGEISNNFENITKCDVVVICVPTPLKKNNDPDVSFIKKTLLLIKNYLRNNQILILESTSYPGTTREEFVQKLNKRFKIGVNFFIGFSSERINPGFNEDSIHKIPKVVSGYSKNCLNLVSKFYNLFFQKVIKSKSLEVAEFSKLLENIYRSVNIGFINEMKLVADKMNLDIFEIIKIAKTKPFGFRPFHPGPGIGGHCIPIDPHYLYWKAKKKGISAKFIKHSAETNLKVISFIKSRIMELLKKNKIKKDNAKILILGVTYKPNIDDLRESGSINLMNRLLKDNIKKVQWSDPHFKNRILIKKYNYSTKGINLTPKALKSFDIILLMTDHDKFKYGMIYKNSKRIIDCRGRYSVDDKVSRA